MNLQKGTSLTHLWKNKGFYITLAVCLLAVGMVAAISLFDTAPPQTAGEEEPPAVTTTTRPTTPSTTVQPVQNPVTGVADLRTQAPTAPPTTVPTTAPVPKELYVLPLTNEVCAPYSGEQPVYSETMGDWRTHTGVDFTGVAGQAVKAAAEGTIAAIRTDVLWGDTVEIDHGFGIVTRYCGVAARNIAVGDVVHVGQEIGVLGTVPCEESEGPHLHLEVLSGDKHLDAVAVIGVEVRYSEDT